jgi:hypothetical protein
MKEVELFIKFGGKTNTFLLKVANLPGFRLDAKFTTSRLAYFHIKMATSLKDDFHFSGYLVEDL